MNRNRIEEKVFSYMNDNQMIEPGDCVVAGVSGGADSVCLFLMLTEYQKRVPFSLAVVHVNHGIRPDAREDEAYVKTLCETREIPFYSVCENVPELAKKNKWSEEDAGRRVRYEAFRRTGELMLQTAGESSEQTAEDAPKPAKDRHARIAVAHNANDRAETMLLHLFRGAGLRGLCGIGPVRGDIIRPILLLERSEIEEYLTECGIRWQTDSTNAEDDYLRNRIRHHVLGAAVEQVGDNVIAQMCSAAEKLTEIEKYMKRQTVAARQLCVISGEGKRLEIDIAAFNGLDPVIQSRLLLELLEEVSPTGRDIGAVHVQDALTVFSKEGSRSISLPYGMTIRRQYGRAILAPEESAERQDLADRFAFQELGRTEIPTPIPQMLYTKWFDYDKIKGTVEVRFRQMGDYLTISDGQGGVIRKYLKDYMITEKIPKEERDRIPVLAEGSQVLWLPGYRISETYKVTDTTERILQVTYKA